jgi:hypothetical protein
VDHRDGAEIVSEEKRKSGAAETRASKPGPAAERPAAKLPEKRSSEPEPVDRQARRKIKPESRRKAIPARAPGSPGPARLFALLAGGFLALLGVLGFFYDAGFDTGSGLASDDLAGTLMVNGWRNVIYLVTGMVALGFAPRRARATALGLGLFYLVYAIWGFIVTDRGIGSILDTLPLGNDDNALHLIIGVLGTFAALVDGPLPKVPEGVRRRLSRLKPKPRPKRKPKPKPAAAKKPLKPAPEPKTEKPKPKGATSARGSRPPGREGPRRGDASEPR